jgi:hypothetical protein
MVMKEILLTQNKVALIDDEDYEKVIGIKWHAIKTPTTYYAANTIHRGKSFKKLRMQYVILGKPANGFVIDHANGNGLDNRKENLRIITQRQNSQNLHMKKVSKYVGVCWDKQKGKWRARTKINGKRKCLGFYTNEQEAAMEYQSWGG